MCWNCADENAGEGGQLHREETAAVRRGVRPAGWPGAGGAAAHGAGGRGLGHRWSLGRKAGEAWNPDGGGPGGTGAGRCTCTDDGDGWPDGVRAAWDLLHALRIGGTDAEGDRRHPQLWKPGHDLAGDARSAGELRNPRSGEDAPVQGGRRQPLRVHAHQYLNNDPFYSNGASARFAATTNDTGEVVALAASLAERLFRDGFRYAKCGVMITKLLPETVQQPALWSELDRERRERAWKTVDRLNATLVRGTVRILSAGPKDTAWKLRADYRSPRWTTRWTELPWVDARGIEFRLV